MKSTILATQAGGAGAKPELAATRRSLLGAGLIAAGAALVPARVFASVSTLSAGDKKVMEIAKREIEKNQATLWRTDRAAIVDFARPSSQPRFLVADFEAGTVEEHLVAHGRGSDPDHDGWLHSFSKDPGSLATSRGAYMTLEWYMGKYGMSMRLQGLEADNATAVERAIVVHEAWYCRPGLIATQGKLGRSEGCFAIPPGELKDLLSLLGGGRLLFADKIGIDPIIPPPVIAQPKESGSSEAAELNRAEAEKLKAESEGKGAPETKDPKANTAESPPSPK